MVIEHLKPLPTSKSRSAQQRLNLNVIGIKFEKNIFQTDNQLRTCTFIINILQFLYSYKWYTIELLFLNVILCLNVKYIVLCK